MYTCISQAQKVSINVALTNNLKKLFRLYTFYLIFSRYHAILLDGIVVCYGTN